MQEIRLRKWQAARSGPTITVTGEDALTGEKRKFTGVLIIHSAGGNIEALRGGAERPVMLL